MIISELFPLTNKVKEELNLSKFNDELHKAVEWDKIKASLNQNRWHTECIQSSGSSM